MKEFIFLLANEGLNFSFFPLFFFFFFLVVFLSETILEFFQKRWKKFSREIYKANRDSFGGGGGNLNEFTSLDKNTLQVVKDTKVRFEDVAGNEEAKEELKEVVKFLKDPSSFSKLGAGIPKGVLLGGSPGTGKTLLAKAIAGEAGVPFLKISGSQFVELLVGVGASRVRELFEKARSLKPSIIS